MPSLLDALSKEHIGRLLFFCRDWNTHGKHALIAHAVLAALFKNKTPQELKQYPTLKEVLPALVPYTERHFARLDAMLQKSFLYVHVCADLLIFISN
jgi:U3 small nucleolar RNA-associated protein 13